MIADGATESTDVWSPIRRSLLRRSPKTELAQHSGDDGTGGAFCPAPSSLRC